jgi:hypothetical protein
VSADFDVARLLQSLASHGVNYVVIGGVAAVLHGSARATFDLDVSFASDQENLNRLGHALLSLSARLRGLPQDVPFIPDGATLKNVEVLTLTTDAGDLDVLARPTGSPPYEELRKNADVYEIDDMTVPVARVEDLLLMKRAAGRPKDIADIAELETILRLR